MHGRRTAGFNEVAKNVLFTRVFRKDVLSMDANFISLEKVTPQNEAHETTHALITHQ